MRTADTGAAAFLRSGAGLVVVLVVAQLAWGVIVALQTDASWIVEGWRNRGDTPQTALARVRGAAYADAVAAIRARIPPDAAYLLVAAGARFGWDEALWLRYDLAPRKGQFLGYLADGTLTTPPGVPDPSFAFSLERLCQTPIPAHDLPPFVVVYYTEEGRRPPPRVEETARFLASCADGRAR